MKTCYKYDKKKNKKEYEKISLVKLVLVSKFYK